MHPRIADLKAPRPWKRVYALTDKEDRPRAVVSVAEVERKYKKRFLAKDGAVGAVEVARGYNTMWKVKGVLSLLYSELSKKYEVLLTAYQPSFARGTSVYSSNFSAYIVKPQQNFYVFDHSVPIFRVRRSLKPGEGIRGRMPLLPSFEMIYPPLRVFHITPELLD